MHALREHYVRTVDAWYATFEDNWDRAVAMVGEEVARVWRLYLVGGALAFEEGRMGVDQILMVKPTLDGRSSLPRGARLLMADFPWDAFLAALPFTLLAAVLVLGTTFLVALRVGRHAVVDVAWGLGFVAVAVASYLTSAGEGDDLRRALLLGMTVPVGDPAGRAHRPPLPRQGRGPALRGAAGARARQPDLVRVPQGLPHPGRRAVVRLAARAGRGPSRHRRSGWLVWVGVAVWAVGLFFEAVGDHQLHRFRDDPASKGQVLDTGLWRYTRHPNYFGDACVWWGLSLVAFSAWPGILTLASPLLMTWFLANGTGKPLLEKEMSARRPGYEDYVRRTSGFFPLPPRR